MMQQWRPGGLQQTHQAAAAVVMTAAAATATTPHHSSNRTAAAACTTTSSSSSRVSTWPACACTTTAPVCMAHCVRCTAGHAHCCSPLHLLWRQHPQQRRVRSCVCDCMMLFSAVWWLWLWWWFCVAIVCHMFNLPHPPSSRLHQVPLCCLSVYLLLSSQQVVAPTTQQQPGRLQPPRQHPLLTIMLMSRCCLRHGTAQYQVCCGRERADVCDCLSCRLLTRCKTLNPKTSFPPSLPSSPQHKHTQTHQA